MIINATLRDKITLYLPKNYAQLIAEETGVHPNTVYNVLYKGNDNMVVSEALIRMADKTKKEKQAKNKELQKIAEQL